MQIKQITSNDNLELIVSQINQAQWDEANEISEYDVESLAYYLQREGTIFVTCHDELIDPPTLLGMASCRLEIKPYGKELWLYVDEVDVCSNHRQRGAGKMIMQALISMAEELGCEEVWLGTETDNLPANALYRSLDPDDIGQVVGYTYETDDELED